MKWLTPFAYVADAGALHLCCDRVLEEVGLPITEENLRMAEEQLLALMQETQPTAKVYSNVTRDLREHPGRIEKEPL